jgi:hypothetical protein
VTKLLGDFPSYQLCNPLVEIHALAVKELTERRIKLPILNFSLTHCANHTYAVLPRSPFVVHFSVATILSTGTKECRKTLHFGSFCT